MVSQYSEFGIWGALFFGFRLNAKASNFNVKIATARKIKLAYNPSPLKNRYHDSHP